MALRRPTGCRAVGPRPPAPRPAWRTAPARRPPAPHRTAASSPPLLVRPPLPLDRVLLKQLHHPLGAGDVDLPDDLAPPDCPRPTAAPGVGQGDHHAGPDPLR